MTANSAGGGPSPGNPSAGHPDPRSSPPPELVAFCRACDGDAGLRAQVKAAITPQQIVDLALARGFVLSAQELRVFSSQLVASYFPWALQSRAWRLQFFAQPGAEQPGGSQPGS